MPEQTCPTCGAAVRVVSSDEGTSHYEPVADAAWIRSEAERETVRRVVAWVRSRGWRGADDMTAAAYAEAIDREFSSSDKEGAAERQPSSS